MKIIQTKPWLTLRYLTITCIILLIISGCLYLQNISQRLQRPAASIQQYGLDYKQIFVGQTQNQRYTWPFKPGDHHFVENHCEVDKCFFTYDQEHVQYSDALLYYSTDLMYDERFLDLHSAQLPQQLWVFVSSDPPEPREELDELDGVFNMAITYRSDSDIVIPHGAAMLRTQTIPQTSDYLSGRHGFILWHVTDCDLLDSTPISSFIDKLQVMVPLRIVSNCPPDPQCHANPSAYRRIKHVITNSNLRSSRKRAIHTSPMHSGISCVTARYLSR